MTPRNPSNPDEKVSKENVSKVFLAACNYYYVDSIVFCVFVNVRSTIEGVLKKSMGAVHK